MKEIFEEIELAFFHCENEGWDAPWFEQYLDGKAVMIWKDKKYLMTLEEVITEDV